MRISLLSPIQHTTIHMPGLKVALPSVANSGEVLILLKLGANSINCQLSNYVFLPRVLLQRNIA